MFRQLNLVPQRLEQGLRGIIPTVCKLYWHEGQQNNNINNPSSQLFSSFLTRDVALKDWATKNRVMEANLLWEFYCWPAYCGSFLLILCILGECWSLKKVS